MAADNSPMVDLAARGYGRQRLLALLAVILALTFLGPFGSALSMSLPSRLAFFLLTVAAIDVFALGVTLFLDWLVPGRLTGWPKIFAIALICALPGALIVKAGLVILASDVASRTPILLLAIQVAVVTFAMAAGTDFLLGERTAIAPSQSEPSSRTPNAIAEKLPLFWTDAAITALKSEDHYLRVFSALGDELILMSLDEAEALFPPPTGMRIHRSWWVSRAAVREIVTKRGTTHVRLEGDLQAPVARRRVAEVRAALRSSA